jgi:hypothetical protein
MKGMNKAKEEFRMKNAKTIPPRRTRVIFVSSFFLLPSSFSA